MYKTALFVLNKIVSKGYKAYIVGGYPRDLYLKRESLDVDICTNATPKDLNEIFNITKQSYGSVTVIVNNIRFEITTFRKEMKYLNNRFPVKIKYIDSLIEDLKRRDFTINTLCIDSNGDLIDLLSSKVDLDNKIIRCVGNTKNKIKEDILRSLRAIRFATILDFKLDDELKKYIKKYGYLLKKLSYYRKKEELDKIFSSSNCMYGISLIKELNLDKYLELSLSDVVISSNIAIWAQLDVLDKYCFTNSEKQLITSINKVCESDILSNEILYKYGLYVCCLSGEIKNIDKSLIVSKYNNLPIFRKKDIKITSFEICEILNKKPNKFLKEIYDDLENKILKNELINDNYIIKKYIKDNYKNVD